MDLIRYPLVLGKLHYAGNEEVRVLARALSENLIQTCQLRGGTEIFPTTVNKRRRLLQLNGPGLNVMSLQVRDSSRAPDRRHRNDCSYLFVHRNAQNRFRRGALN